MSKKKHAHAEKENNERWLLTYSDLITLLMIFFVVMYAMSNVDVAKYRLISQSLGVAMGGGKNVIQVTPGVADTIDRKSPGAAGFTASQGLTEEITKQNLANIEKIKLEEIKKQIDSYLNKSGLQTSVATDISERGLEVSLRDTVLFDSGKSVIKPEAVPKLIAIGKIVDQIPNYIKIEGHTDNVPIHTGQFPTNWELSAVRATTVTELLINAVHIPPTKISAVGYGEFRPIASNSTEAGRTKNRRVNIVILSSKFNATEVNKPE